MNQTSQTVVPKIIPKTFFFPEIEEYPFDVVCKNIVQALYQRGWDVPGITVEFDESVKGHSRSVKVGRIKGNDFHIDFHRSQKHDHGTGLYNSAAAGNIGIPKWDLSVYEDHSGPCFYVYVGNNWDAEKDHFFNGLKVNSKLCREPRTYLKYSGNSYKNSKILKHDNDLDREYECGPEDKKVYDADEVNNIIAKWLINNVLIKIYNYPVTNTIDVAPYVLNPLTDIEKDKLKSETLTVLTSDWSKYEKIRNNPTDETILLAQDMYAFVQNTRLLNLGISIGDSGINKIAHDGFVWSELGSINNVNDLENSILYRRSNIDGGSFGRILYSVTIFPKYSNEIYVIDASAREEFKSNYFQINIDRKMMDDIAFNTLGKVEALTLVPLLEYDGSFKEPLILFRRSIELEEVISIQEIPIKDMY